LNQPRLSSRRNSHGEDGAE